MDIEHEFELKFELDIKLELDLTNESNRAEPSQVQAFGLSNEFKLEHWF